jgi:diguanylate cyclase (GGDEF)-like protein
MLFEQMRRGRADAPVPFWISTVLFFIFALILASFSRFRGVSFWAGWFALVVAALGLSWGCFIVFQIYGSPISIFIFALATAVGILIDDLYQAETEKKVFFYLATRDGLTDLYSIRHFRLIMNQITSESVVRGERLALILMDIDYFKVVNDTLGHLAGDEVLKKTAEVLTTVVRQKRPLRDIDFIARYGGEEFMILIRRSDLETATDIAERIRETIEKTVFEWQGKNSRITVSLGVATIQSKEDIPDLMVHRADQALYLAKRAGRNRVCTEADPQ